MEDLYKKYEKIFGYANTIIFTLLERGKTKERFKQISMDYEDIKQEVYIEMLKAIREYEEKYQDIEKVFLEPHIKNLCEYVMMNLLRDNSNKVFVHIDSDLQDELKDVFEKIKPPPFNIDDPVEELEENPKFKELPESEQNKLIEKALKISRKQAIHPDLIPNTGAIKEQLSDNKILDILDEVCDDDIDMQIAKLTFLDGLTLKEVRDELGLGTRAGAHWRLKKIVSRLKKKYKTVEQLFAK